jgi:hypothetical protein
MRFITTLILILLLASAPFGVSSAAVRQVTVAEPYLELHTGPGRGYPVFHVVDRGENVGLVKRRTDWIKVRVRRGVEGWVKLASIKATLDPDGQPARIQDPGAKDYAGRRSEVGILAGDFGGANMVSTYVAYQFTANLSAELGVSQALGQFSSSTLGSVSIVHTPFPEWRIAPYFTLGTGYIHTEPEATLVQTEDRDDQFALFGIGLRAHLTRRLMLRAEYKSYLILTSRDDNEEVDEWKAGFAFFF